MLAAINLINSAAIEISKWGSAGFASSTKNLCPNWTLLQKIRGVRIEME